MYKTIRFSVGSVNRSIQGQKVLRRNGFRAWVHRRTEPGADGCGYALDVVVNTAGEENAVTRLLTAAGIPLLDRRESGWDA